VLFGDVDPGGRLPVTFPNSVDDLPTAGDPEKYPGVAEQVKYKEGVLVGYRWFDEMKKDVAFPFGFGLSYSTFAFSDLRLEPVAGADAKVSVLVRNTGKRAGTAVAQLYVGLPEPEPGVVQPPFALKGFEKVKLAAGASRRASFTLDERAFSYWAGTRWRVAPGCYRIGVGASSRDLPQQGVVGRGQECEGALQLLRSLRSCSSRRVITITLPRTLERAARVTFAGRTAKVRRSGRRLKARIDMRTLKAGRVTIRISGRTKSGRRVRQTRVFRTCAKRS
jgi:hypothetical protein